MYLKSLQFSKCLECKLIFSEGDIIDIDHRVFKKMRILLLILFNLLENRCHDAQYL